MVEAARAVSARLSRGGLPDEIVIWEILVRLPPKSLLRCRAVCSAWRRLTSSRDFLLAHHSHQPTLPLAFSHDGIITFDHDAQLQHVARLDKLLYRIDATCDGLLLLRSYDMRTGPYFSVCNLATRQSTRLPMISHFFVLGMYAHHPTGEYRVLLYRRNKEINGHDACYIFAVGSVQPPRNIGWQQEGHEVCYGNGEPVLLHGNLHWPLEQHETGSNTIAVFDTTTESFRQLHAPAAPVVPRYNDLFEMDGVLGLSSRNCFATSIDIWVLHDYESEVWTFKHKIELPITRTKVLCEAHAGAWDVVVAPGEGELLVLVNEWLFQIDMDGKLVATSRCKEVVPTKFQLKQTLVPHTFFPQLEGYAVNDSPFI